MDSTDWHENHASGDDDGSVRCVLGGVGRSANRERGSSRLQRAFGFQTGIRESVQSWKELLVDLKARGLSIAPEVAVGDGALGFWKALDETFPATRHQRCWLHKTLNVLDKFSKVRSAQCTQRPARNLAGAGSSDGGDGDCDIRR